MIIYEDVLVQVDLPDNGVVQGQMIISPKQEVKTTAQIDDDLLEHLFFTASYAATVLFETLGAHGTNIILNEDPVSINVIARKAEDTWSHQWTPQAIDQGQMDDVVDKISDNIPLEGEDSLAETSPTADSTPSSSTESQKASPEEKTISHEEAKENYLIRQLHRVP